MSVQATNQYWRAFAVISAILFTYAAVLVKLSSNWWTDENYSHGLLVPFFSAYLIRRAWRSGTYTPSPMPVVGCVLLVVALAMRVASGALLFHPLDAASTSVLDLTSFTVIQTIPNVTSGTCAVASTMDMNAADAGHVYVASNTQAGFVTLVDVETNSAKALFPVGARPLGIAIRMWP